MIRRKYELLTDDSIKHGRTTLYRIRAIIDFSDVKAGDLGGYIEKEANLDHLGDCWVYDNSKVYEDAYVCQNAQIRGNARMSGYSIASDNALLSDDCVMWGNSRICDNAKAFNQCKISGYAWIREDAELHNSVTAFGNILICGSAKVYKSTRLHGNAEIRGNAVIRSQRDYIVFKNWWSSGRYFTWTRSNDKWTVGCFHGTGKELVAKAYKESKESGREYARVVRYVKEILKEESKKE